MVSVVSVVFSPNFLSEGVSCGLDKEIALDGTYLKYFPFRAMIERSQMTPYHKKFQICRQKWPYLVHRKNGVDGLYFGVLLIDTIFGMGRRRLHITV